MPPRSTCIELLGRRANPEDRSEREEAIEFLKSSGVLDAAQPASRVQEQAGDQGIGEKTLQRARRSLGIPAWKAGFPGVWMWGPNRTDELDTPTLSSSSSSAPTCGNRPRPARTGQTGQGWGNAEPNRPKACLECGFWPHQGGHSSACSSFARRDLA